MTNKELINMLMQHPFSAEVYIYNADYKELAPVTGCTTGPDPTKGVYVVELHSDDIS